MSRSKGQGRRNWRFNYDLDPSPMYMIEVEPYIEKERSLLREAQEAYKKEEKKYQRLRKKRAELQKNFDQINVKIKKEIEEEKGYQRLHKKRADFQKKKNSNRLMLK